MEEITEDLPILDDMQYGMVTDVSFGIVNNSLAGYGYSNDTL